MTPSPELMQARNRLAAFSRHRGPDDPRTRAARNQLVEVRLAEAIESADLDAAARARLAGLLLGGGA